MLRVWCAAQYLLPASALLEQSRHIDEGEDGIVVLLAHLGRQLRRDAILARDVCEEVISCCTSKRMAELIALGMDPVAASKQAINDVLYPIKRFTEQAATAAAHVREKDFLADCAPENRAAARCGTKFWREVGTAKKELEVLLCPTCSQKREDEERFLEEVTNPGLSSINDE